MATEPITFLVERFIAYQAITLLVGPSGCGKSSLSTALAGAVSRGERFAGLTTKQAPVLILDRENSLPFVQERLSRLRVRTSDYFKIWGGWAGHGPPSLDAEILVRYVEECNPKPLIIVDSFVAFHPGNENDAKETRAYVNLMRRLASLDAAIVSIHHNGKAESAQKYGGSSDIEAAVDVAFTVRNSGGYRLEKVQVEVFKSRFTTAEVLTFQYDHGVFSYTSDKVASSADGKLHDILEANPRIMQTEFESKAKDIGVSRGDARKFLRHPHVARDGSKNTGYYYRLKTQDELAAGI
jgi:archaellum biogenesis ATPase FlaH